MILSAEEKMEGNHSAAQISLDVPPALSETWSGAELCLPSLVQRLSVGARVCRHCLFGFCYWLAVEISLWWPCRIHPEVLCRCRFGSVFLGGIVAQNENEGGRGSRAPLHLFTQTAIIHYHLSVSVEILLPQSS